MVKNYYVFRHAQTLATLNNQLYGDNIISADIIPEGFPPIQRLADYLKQIPSDLNLTSEFLRCTRTVKIVSQITGQIFKTDQRLNEYYQETFDQLKERVQNLLEELNQSNLQTVIICSHGAVIAGLTHLITTNIYSLDQLHDYPTPGVLLHIENKEIKTIDFN